MSSTITARHHNWPCTRQAVDCLRTHPMAGIENMQCKLLAWLGASISFVYNLPVDFGIDNFPVDLFRKGLKHIKTIN